MPLIARHCARCGKELTDAASMEEGVGPICRGMDNHLLATLMPANFKQALMSWEMVKAEAFPAEAQATFAMVVATLKDEEHDADQRKTVKRIEWLLSFNKDAEVFKWACATVDALGYLALSAMWQGLAASGEARVWLKDGRLYVAGPRCKGANDAIRKIPGRKGQGDLKDNEGAFVKFAWSVPASASEQFAAVVAKHYPNHTGLREAIAAVALVTFVGGPVALKPENPAVLTKYETECHAKTPYKVGFIAELKASVPPSCRKWDPDKKVWVIKGYSSAALAQIMEKHYGPVTVVNG